MASNIASAVPATPQVERVGSRTWERLLLPSFSDCLFVVTLIWLCSGGSGGLSGLLADGDTGWHIRTGEWILKNGTVPHQDLYSFSKAGEPWFAWEWLTDVIYAVLHDAAGLKGLVVLSALLISACATVLFRHMIAAGATPFAALAVSLIAFGASTIHYLARPHLFTLLGMTISLFLIDADRRRPSWRIWILLPMTLLWVNLHGGFLGLIAILGLLSAGSVAEAGLEAWIGGSTFNFGRAKRYVILSCLCGAVTFINPYGWHLHEHVWQYLRSDWIKNNIQEFQSPTFRSESAMQFEIMLILGLMTVAWLLMRRQIVPALWILFWAHCSLTSARHVPLFMIVAAPWVAAGFTELWQRYVERGGKKTIRGIFASLGRDMKPGCSRSSIWIVATCVLFALLPDGVVHAPKDFPDVKFPSQMVARHREKLIAGRTLTMDQWADYLIYHNYPRQKVFVDGRSDFYGPEIGDQYLHLAQGRPEWKKLIEKHRFDVVLSPIDWPLGSLLKMDPDWRLVDDDGKALLFERARPNRPSVPVPSAQGLPPPREKTPSNI